MRARWLEPSPGRERMLLGTGCVLLGIILAQAAIVGPASSCGRAPLHAGGDMVPGFCVDYGASWSGWPLLLAGLGAMAIGVVQLHRAAGATRFPTTSRAALLLVLAGAVVLYASWSDGSASVCQFTFDGPDATREPTCVVEHEAWRDAALVGGGALAGAGAMLAGAVAVRASQGSDTAGRLAGP